MNQFRLLIMTLESHLEGPSTGALALTLDILKTSIYNTFTDNFEKAFAY